ncbi:tetratricopeptide (TPR) repeat protein/transglutaminase-like putative cysteine protease [Sphingomonas leidyi]|uniref:Tetratricopeptide (TPR) repeat protein/transglutaminase-like putative cysteine protease n=1 Tax=Sphingomonas leidyi TaxID=68569 RepID=A0A7X5ZYG0_9SPHN|nr:DUF3857 domain-containing protein [Sphingomonas leidyi]NIJ67363.1 tetratricopeptide (TPR) repeat protein/transglutaminase-like putative cysteine protease [Sphingomonas leidyi]
MYRNALASILFLGASGVAHAGEKPLYQPVPDWVRLAPEPAATGLTDDAPAMVIGDVQARIADGQSWTYYERATRLASILAVSQAGTINLEWHPAHGDLIVHGVDILRGGKRIDALKGKSFTVLRREQGLDEMKFDGRLTATLAVEGLQVGDVLDLRYSVTMRDPALGGNAVIVGPVVAEPIKVGFVRTRLLWPTGQAVKWKTYPVGAEPQVRDAGGWHELVFKLPVARQPEMPARMPGRFARPPIAEATTFADWQSVSKAMAPLYRVDGLIAPGSALAAEVAKIAAAEKDPRKRTAAALALVQGKVRYLFRGMDNGNYVPQTPAETWTTKYGDCKAKTLLLLAILRELGIEAEPATANLANGDLVAERLASPAAFNHVFVLARVGGQLLWLDGTGTGTRLEDIDDVLPFDWVLPLRAEGAGLLQVPARAPVRATGATVFDIDLTGGIDVPAPFEMKVTTRGAAEGGLKALMGLRSKESLLDMFRNLVPAFGQDMLLTGSDVSFDEASGTATIALSGILNRSWRYQDGRFRLDAAAPIAYQIPDRTRANWKDIPIATGNPMRTSNAMRVRLPEMGGYVLEGDAALDATLPGGKRVVRRATLAGGLLSIDTEDAQTGAEIAPAEIPAARAKLAELNNRVLRVRTLPGAPGPWRGVEAAKRAGKYDKVLARYAAYIAEKPEDVSRYLARARFLAKIFERQKALADFDKAIGMQATAATYRERAALHRALGHKAESLADLRAAQELDPGNTGTLYALASELAKLGRLDEALALLQPRIDEEGENQPDLLAAKGAALGHARDAAGALAALDAAIAKRPGNAGFLNGRCWIKGTLDVQLDTALKDCTRAIELGSGGAAAAALDSRALVYFRMRRFEEALADINAALEQRPAAANSLFLRGLILRRTGDAKAGDAALAEAELLFPQVNEDFARYGIKP